MTADATETAADAAKATSDAAKATSDAADATVDAADAPADAADAPADADDATADAAAAVAATVPAAAAAPVPSAPVTYRMLVDTFAQVEATTKRLEILELVTSLLVRVIRQSVANGGPLTAASDNLLQSVYLCINRLCPDYEGLELGIGEGLLIKAIAQSTGRGIPRIKKEFEAKGDLGLVAVASKRHQPTMFRSQALTVPFVFRQLQEIAAASGAKSQDKKLGIIKRLLAACTGEESKYLIRSLEGKLRIGLAEKTVLVAVAHAVALARLGARASEMDAEALAAELERGATVVKAVFSELPSYDRLVPALLEYGPQAVAAHLKLTPGIPLKPMLAKPTKAIGEVLDRFEDQSFTCEYKYDGERAQVHGFRGARGERVIRVFSRNSEDMSIKYPDLVVQVPRCLAPDVESFVLDAEVVAWEPGTDGAAGRLLPFQELSRRKRKDVKAEDVRVAVKLFAFDLLYLNGTPLLHAPLEQRRAQLYAHFVVVPNEFDYATRRDCTTTEEIQTFLDESVAHGCEGLMVKMLAGPDATYEPSRRSINWLKLKKDYLAGTGDSLDLTVIGGYYGRGKRTKVYGAVRGATDAVPAGLLYVARLTQTTRTQRRTRRSARYAAPRLTRRSAPASARRTSRRTTRRSRRSRCPRKGGTTTSATPSRTCSSSRGSCGRCWPPTCPSARCTRRRAA